MYSENLPVPRLILTRLTFAGNFVFDFEQQIELDHEARHHHEDSHGECRRSEDGSMKRFMRGFKHFFKKEHCPHCDGYEELDYETHLNLQAQKSKYSSWLTDLKKTDPMFGEMYFSYAIRALRRRRRPLPQHLIPKYHGFKCKKLLYHSHTVEKQNLILFVCLEFHVWPELTGTFIMYYLFHCQVGESNHLHFHEYEDDVKECHERSCQYESSYHSESHDHHDHSRESEHTRD
ncbi:Hypothetical protein CINCED_3A000262 [Cinara cedri]|uniref:Uncharacterized protein n=1 Tax=Cinara cedri TaxID=506608 RepID=A0A5E4MMD9_9HEMI|nr:Hypothetical protein CINCED_3A000262 [Cinara cedri]